MSTQPVLGCVSTVVAMTPPRSVEAWAEACRLAGHTFGLTQICYDCVRTYAAEQVAQARAAEREACATILDKQATTHRRNEERNREIGNTELERHNKWCAVVLETALAAIRARP